MARRGISQKPRCAVGAQALHAPEVEERDGAVVVEQVVAGVRVGVEHAEAGDAPEEEAVDDLAPPVAQRLVDVVDLGPPPSVDHLHGEHPVARELGEHLGHADERMAAVVLGELRLVRQLGARSRAPRRSAPTISSAMARTSKLRNCGHDALGDLDEREEQLGVGQVVADGVGDARVLHLDRDLGAVVQAGGVDLADRRGGDRRGGELGEELLGRAPELALDDGGHEHRVHRLGVGLQRGEGGSVHLAVGAVEGGADVDEGQDLAHLHQHALRAGQDVGVALGVADVELEAGAPLALEAAAQDVDDASARGPGGEGGERRRAPQPALGDRHRRPPHCSLSVPQCILRRCRAPSTPTRERLLDEAMRLFGERGYDATSVAEIERSAGLTPGAGGLFHHFRTKEAVLVAGIERQLARLEAVRQIRGAIPPLGDLRAELTLVARYVFLELEEEQELLRVLISESRQRPHLLTGAVEQVVRGTFNEFAALLARSGGTEVGAALALGSLVAFASAELLLGQAPVDADREEVIATWVEMVMGLVERVTPG